MQGHRRAWHGTDTRKRRIQIFEFDAGNLFNFNAEGYSIGKRTRFWLGPSDSHTVTGHGGGGGAEAAAFIVKKFRGVINTRDGIIQQGIPGSLLSITGSVKLANPLSISDWDNSFLRQQPQREVQVFRDPSYLLNIGKYKNKPEYP